MKGKHEYTRYAIRQVQMFKFERFMYRHNIKTFKNKPIVMKYQHHVFSIQTN